MRIHTALLTIALLVAVGIGLTQAALALFDLGPLVAFLVGGANGLLLVYVAVPAVENRIEPVVLTADRVMAGGA